MRASRPSPRATPGSAAAPPPAAPRRDPPAVRGGARGSERYRQRVRRRRRSAPEGDERAQLALRRVHIYHRVMGPLGPLAQGGFDIATARQCPQPATKALDICTRRCQGLEITACGRRRRAPLTPRLPRAGSRRAAPAHRCHEDWHAEAERQPADAHGHAHSLRERDAGTSESERGGAPWPPAPPAGLWLARMGWMDARGICAERRCPRPQSRTLRGVPGCQVASRRGAQRRGQRGRTHRRRAAPRIPPPHAQGHGWSRAPRPAPRGRPARRAGPARARGVAQLPPSPFFLCARTHNRHVHAGSRAARRARGAAGGRRAAQGGGSGERGHGGG